MLKKRIIEPQKDKKNPTTWKGKIKLIDAYSECNNSEAWYNFLVNQLKGYKFPQWNTTFPTMEMTQIKEH